MKFRDQLAALIAEDKKKDAEPIFDALDRQLDGYDTDIKALKTSLREKDGIKPEDFTRLEHERDELKTALTDMQKNVKTLTKERDEYKTAAEKEIATSHRELVENRLTDALTKAGVKKELLPAARALLREKGVLSVKTEGDARRAIASLQKDGKAEELSLEDYVEKHFATSDEGKAFIPANTDSGSGAGGGSAKTATGPKARYAELNTKKPEDLTPAESRELVVLAGNPEVTKP